MIEFALSIPFLLLILFSVIYFGRYFLIAQTVLHAAQEGAKVASRTPNLIDADVRATVRGFSTDGTQVNSNSPIYTAMAAARLLSNGTSGNMPPGSKVQILPWDADGTTTGTIPPGTVGVEIDYPFQLLSNPFTNNQPQTLTLAMAFNGQGTPLKFLNFSISERAVAAQEVFQQ